MIPQDPSRHPTCPACGGAVERISRRWIDRLLSRFAPSRRYRCRSMNCHWAGNLRNARYDLPSGDAEKRYDRRFD